MSNLPGSLIRSLRSGECVAFVGSGFTGAAKLPSWSKLLTDLSRRAGFDAACRAHVQELLERETAHAYDEAAQIIEDTLGRETFTGELKARLGRPPSTPAMERRLKWLRGIPFRAILTTNFDGVLEGSTPSGNAFRDILRPEGSNPWWKWLFQREPPRAVPVLKVHGDVCDPGSVVITRSDYRRLLYGNSGYMPFLRAVLANRPVLFMGFSFTDAYLNELRSEVLALLSYSGEAPAVAYAIVNDVSAFTRAHYRKHEGIEMLSYDTAGGTDYSGFDAILEELHDRTNPLFHFGTLLQGKRLLWVDPRPDNNEHVRRFFRLAKDVAAVLPDSFVVDLASTADEALSRLEKVKQEASQPFDLVITHWGRDSTPPTAVALLEGMRKRDLRSPVLIFSTSQDANERKRKALALGAQAYCFGNEGLLRSIERILSPGEQTG